MDAILSTEKLVSDTGSRFRWLDAHRGFIMILMAIDHAAGLIARQHAGEYWGVEMHVYDDPLAFLTRFITHICAPGFFLFMGMGILFLEQSRRKRGWSEGRITRHLALRGGLLLLIQHLIENPAWILGLVVFASPDLPASDPVPGVMGLPFFVFGVMTSLGLSMIVLAFIRRLPWWLILGFGIGFMLLSQWAIPGTESIGIGYPLYTRLILIPGMTPPVMVMYPLIPWLGVAMIGYAFGVWVKKDETQARMSALWIGLGLVGIFFLIRLIGTFGNTHPYESGDWMAFMNVTKYPPSLAYLSWTMGLNFLLLFVFSQINDRLGPRSPLTVFGQTALFFYIVHLYVYALMGSAFPMGTNFGIMYGLWLLGLLFLYPICRWYGKFKRGTKPESFWRML